MEVEVLVLFWRIWGTITALLAINALAVFVFSPSWRALLNMLSSWLFILIWPLSIFSPKGRASLLNKTKEL